MVGLFQLQLVEVTSVTKTEPRCISQARKLYATITEAKTQEAHRTRQNLLARCVKRLQLWKCMTLWRKCLKRHYTHTLLMFSLLPKLPILRKTTNDPILQL